MTRPVAKVQQVLNIWIRCQNGEIEVVKRCKVQLGTESFKAALLRVMREATK